MDTLAPRAQGLFEAALELPVEDRPAFLRGACAGDDGLMRAVESLLVHDAGASGFLDQPYVPPRDTGEEVVDPLVGATLGAYRVVRRIGRGGMGVVYLGERSDDEFRQQVAIKVLRPGLANSSLERRFRNERQILASLEHPGITRLLDGGTTSGGEPYLVMEYVLGVPITEYCDRHELSVTERLELVLTVCDAVRYAHQHLVVHRDIKPSNLLVGEDGRPKLLDFGIARLLEADDEGVDETSTQLRVLTPNYASPEHLLGQRITPASDVFSLGVVLYELLSGRRPYEWRGRPPGEIAAAIEEQEPPLPSATVGSPGPDHDPPVAIAAARTTTPEGLRRRLRGDLDMIVLQSLRFEAERRFGSADELAADIRRHLDGRPVTARPATWRYRAGKFLRRNALLLLLGVAITAFGATSAVQTRRVSRERDEAELARERAEEVSRFLLDSFELADPSASRGETITVREVLEKGEARIHSELDGQPELQASLLRSVGVFYTRMDIHEKAAAALRGALDLELELHGPEHLDVATVLYHLSILEQARGDYEAAEALARRSRALHQALLDESDERLAEQSSSLAVILMWQGRDDEAEPLLEEAIGLLERTGAGEAELLTPVQNLAALRYRRGELEEAVVLFDEVLQLKRKHLGDHHPQTANALANLGVVESTLGRHHDAARHHDEALAIRRALFGEEHPLVAASEHGAGNDQYEAGAFERAEPLLRAALATRRRILGDRHAQVADTANVLANLLTEMGALDEADELYEEALSIRRELFGEESDEVATVFATSALLAEEQGEPARAEELLRRALAIRQVVLGDDHRRTADVRLYLADLLAERGALAEARTLADEATRIYADAFPPGHWRQALALGIRGRILVGEGRPDEARAALREASEQLEAQRGAGALWTRRTLGDLTELGS